MTLTSEVRAFLTEPRFAVLGTINKDGSIQQTVMWYLLEGDTILMNTNNVRTKFRNLSTNPNVSICVHDGYKFVTIQGKASLNNEQTTAQADIARIGLRYVSKEVFNKDYRPRFEVSERVSITVPIDHTLDHGF